MSIENDITNTDNLCFSYDEQGMDIQTFVLLDKKYTIVLSEIV